MLISPPGIQPELQEKPSRSSRKQTKWPRITWHGYNLIRDSGGRYFGFVDGSYGSFFDDLTADSWMRLDADTGEMQRLGVITEGAKSGAREAQGPEELKAYATTIVTRDVAHPGMQTFRIIHGPYQRRISRGKRRALARKVHDYVRKNVERMEPVDLRDGVRAIFA